MQTPCQNNRDNIAVFDLQRLGHRFESRPLSVASGNYAAFLTRRISLEQNLQATLRMAASSLISLPA